MNTPKNFALQLGALIALYATIASLVTLLFSVINLLIPDAADYYYRVESATETIRFSIATLVVVFPTYLYLTRSVNQIRRQSDGSYLTLTKWLIYLSLLLGGGIIIGDLVAVIFGFLEGELTMRFLLKAGVLAAVVLLAFYYYLKDAHNYWQDNERKSKQFGLLASVLVITSLIGGFLNSETPQEVRQSKIDDNQIQDLQDMQWRIEDYHRTEGELPKDIDILYFGVNVPVASEGRADYLYSQTSSTTYQLCASFAQDSAASEYTRPVPVSEKNYNWSHGKGDWCYERTVSTVKTID